MLIFVGSYEVDLSFVYEQEGREIFARWFVLSEPKRKHRGIQGSDYFFFLIFLGYLKATVMVLGPGDVPIDHEVDEEFEEDPTGSTLQSMVLMPPEIAVEDYQLVVNCYKAENLPPMDLSLLYYSF